ncbi:WxL protein peptidoglycan domain-containing protein [Occultella kanbiaonis]|uniref:WxL protein peptidoglycan domain-containing protein n=1 Tax=Occultella kanbiaonis TaxID=2675754 RepID=UPI0012B73665|nr:DUF916 domain-containing protein [Occultella kanbiaonis]
MYSASPRSRPAPSTVRVRRPDAGTAAAARARPMLWVLVLALLVGTTVGGQAPAAADVATDELTWSVAPADNDQGTGRPNFNYAVSPGDVIADAFVVTNLGTAELPLAIYAADGYTTPQGHLDLQPADVAPADLGTWVTLETTEVTLGAGESVEVPFTLAVPVDASPGDHPGGIVAAYTSSADGGTVRLDRRLGSRLHVRVAGEQQVGLEVSNVRLSQDLVINPIAAAPTVLTYTVTNVGNVRTLAHESVTLGGPGGSTVTGTVEEIMPGSAVERSVVLSGWPLIRVNADLVLTPEAVDGVIGADVAAGASTWAVPWGWLMVLFVILAVAVVIGVRRGRRESAA